MPGWASTEQGVSLYFLAFLSLLGLVLILSKFLHDRPRLAQLFPEAGMVILIGMAAGSLIFLVVGRGTEAVEGDDDASTNSEDVAQGLLSFSPEVFFVALLPPIIFNSGYHLRRELFFFHITPIVLFACLGSVVSTLVIALFLEFVKSMGLIGGFDPTFSELLTFGGLISATDPVSTLAVFSSKKVDPQLFYLVFGESCMNDAVGLVLFKICSEFVARDNGVGKFVLAVFQFLWEFSFDLAGSLCLGFACGMAVAFLLKTVDMRSAPLLELSLYVMVVYIPFFISEILEFSGIVTILFTGIAAKRYAVPNLSPNTDSDADTLFRLAAYLAETAIFLELGMSVFGIAIEGHIHWKFISWALLACLVGRILNIYPITVVYNSTLGDEESRSGLREHLENSATGNSTEIAQERNPAADSRRPERRIKFKTAHMMCFSGLRGAVAYACAKTFPETFGHRSDFVVTTMAIILVTVFLLGTTTDLALNLLNIEVNVNEDSYFAEQKGILNFGMASTLEHTYIMPCVIRNYVRVVATSSIGGSPAQSSAGPRPATIPEAHTSYSHVEVTEEEHLETVQRNEVRRKRSLYDYGASV